MAIKERKALLDHLLTFVSENKRNLFEKIIADRTKHVTIALENIFQPQNASAVIRSCDVFGIQDVHIIENSNKYNINPKVVMGASKWITLHKYNKEENNTLACIYRLKADGYKVYATTPHTNDCLIQHLPLENKVALLFGTELEGLSDVAMQHADGYVKIPMYGFTESLNISVCAAISLYEISRRLKDGNVDWRLPEADKTEQLITWAKKVVKGAELIEKDFLTKKASQ